MLNPNFAPAEPPTNSLIAGHHCGIHIHCTPQAKGAYDELAALSRKGNHWARLAIKGIAELSSGRANMDNVYTKADVSNTSYDRGMFYVSLPGIFAAFDSHNDSSFKLTSLSADASYFEHQKGATNPGLWRAEQRVGRGEWFTEYVGNGRLSPKHEKRHVVIADREHDSPNDAANSAAMSLSNVNDTIRRGIEDDGFDLHFTPGGKKIAGLKIAKRR